MTNKRPHLLTRTRGAVLGLCALAAGSAGLSANVEVPILLYGQIGDTAHNEFWVTTDNFTRHMQGLKDRGFTTITPDQLLDIRAGNTTAPEKPILLTFTNGYENLRTIVDPVLAEHGFQATAMILPGRVGGNSSWDEDDINAGAPVVDHLTWAELRQLRDNGRWSFGSHTMTHPRLTELTATQRQNEIANSKLEIQQNLNVTPVAFSYPYGAHNSAIQQQVQSAGYEMAFGVRTDVSHQNIWALPRFDVDNSVTVGTLFGPQWLNDASSGNFNPADTNQDWNISIGEVTAYGAAWRRGESWDTGPSPIEIGYVTRAGALWRNGGSYTYDPNGDGANAWVNN